MARELRRLLIGRDRLVAAGNGPLPLTAEESRYLERVLRYRPGDGFAVVDGEGSLWTARLRDDRCADLEQPLAAPRQQSARPLPRLVLAAAVVKRDFELVVRMAVELGADAVIPLVCEHTAVQGQLRPERWRSIAAEAAEQCERLWQPEIAAPLPVAALLTQLPSGALQLWASARGDGRPELDALLEPLGPQAADAPTQVCLACGPEGGWSEGEELQAQAQGWQPVGLGPRILRSSTACVAGLSVISLWRARRWGC